MKFNKKIVTLYILNPNSSSHSYPSYNKINNYPIMNLNYKYIQNLINKVYSKNYKEEYYKFTVSVTGEVIKTTGQMPNPMVELEAFRIIDMIYIP